MSGHTSTQIKKVLVMAKDGLISFLGGQESGLVLTLSS